MNDLYDWFSRQHHGLRTFQLFQVKLADLSKREPDKMALYALLSRLAGRYVDAFDEEPVPVPVAERAYNRLLRLLASLDRSVSAEGRLAELNHVAALDLLTPTENRERWSTEPASRLVMET